MTIRDRTARIISDAQALIEQIATQEQAGRQARDRQTRKQAEDASNNLRSQLLKQTDASSIYLYLNATQAAGDVGVRSAWQTEMLEEKDAPLRHLKGWEVDRLYEGYFATPAFNLAVLPACSLTLQFTFTLAQPYISKDDNAFYIIDNPIVRDRVFRLPLVRASSWKGNLRAALWQNGFRHDSENHSNDQIKRMFGDVRGKEGENADEERGQSGRLIFFPTFFTQTSLEIINPHDRKTRVGKNPILFESVPVNAQGTFTLLYVPFDRIGEDETQTRKQVTQDLQVLAEGVRAMFRVYGFSAKRTSGFGLAEEDRLNGVMQIRVEELAQRVTPAKLSQAIAQPELPRYLIAPNQLKHEYLNPDGTFRERSEAELKAMKKADRQEYEKAKKWREREGKSRAEAAETPPAPDTPTEPSKPQWLTRSFTSFNELVQVAEAVAAQLTQGGAQ